MPVHLTPRARTLVRASIGTAAVLAVFTATPLWAQGRNLECVAQKQDIVGCQPSAFNVPVLNIPTKRINAQGKIDATAPEADVRAGAKLLEQQMGLFRNMEHLHWVPMTPSRLDPATGRWSGGDLDAQGDGRALTISGKCLFAGHANPNNGTRPMEIFRISDDPIKNPPVKVGEIAAKPGWDDSIMSSSLFTKANGQQTIIVARDVSTDDGGLWVYEVNPADCKVVKSAEGFEYGGDLHEMGMWIDPKNPLRHLIVTAAWSGAGKPDPNRPGKVNPDIRVHAITDEKTGEMLAKPTTLAHFTLQDVGGPVQAEKPDATGLFADGRYPDYTQVKDQRGQPIAYPTTQGNYAHQVTFAADGKRVYVAHGVAGFYILNSEAIAANTNAALQSGTAGCNFESTNVYADGVIGGRFDPNQLPKLASDCLRMVVVDDPGMKAILAAKDVVKYVRLMDRSRFDQSPSQLNSTGMHSAIPVPGRPSLDAKNTDRVRPSYMVVSTERPNCPTSFMYLVNVEAEAFPHVTGTFGVAQNELKDCVDPVTNPILEADGTPRANLAWMNHNPTVFKNLIFVSWYGHGIRVVDISNPYNLREVGHAVPAPAGVARSYPVFDHGLIYWVDNRTGIHVARYNGPFANEIPTDAVYTGNDGKHH